MRTELADVNVLVAVVLEDHDDHSSAISWLRSTRAFATTPITEIGLVRLLMNPAISGRPVPMAEAVAILRSIKALESASFLSDSTSLADHRAIIRHVTGTKQITDTHLLNLAIANGLRLVTFDNKLSASLTATARRHVRVLG